ncbi:MAG: hypothetical protein IKA20_02165 [Clostridia bacterium]|nr:hypothetical protein [Clostridia bacterium]
MGKRPEWGQPHISETPFDEEDVGRAHSTKNERRVLGKASMRLPPFMKNKYAVIPI